MDVSFQFNLGISKLPALLLITSAVSISKMLMERGNPTGPVLDRDLQMQPTPKASYVDLQGVISELDHERSFSEHKAKVPN